MFPGKVCIDIIHGLYKCVLQIGLIKPVILYM